MKRKRRNTMHMQQMLEEHSKASKDEEFVF
jgi:hypothetical protein